MMVPAVEQFVAWLLQSSVEACVLISLVLLCQTILRRKLSPGWRHALWCLLLVRLLLPWSPTSPWSVYNLIPLVRAHSAAWTLPSAPQEFVIAHAVGAATGSWGSRGERVPAGLVAGCIWLAGAVSLAAFVLLKRNRLARHVRRRPLVTDAETCALLDECKRKMGIRRKVLGIAETAGMRSPALFGLLHPYVLLPTGTIRTLDRDHLRHVFLHELAHLRRCDIFINWLATSLQILHWFNPAVWYAFHRMRTDRELACDALVLSRLRPEESEQYGRTIVHLLERFRQCRSLACAAGFFDRPTQMRRRIEMIANFKRGAGSSRVLAVVLLASLGAVTLTGAQRAPGEKTAVPENSRNLIVPGERVGQFTIGARKAVLIDRLGQPRTAFLGGDTFALDHLPNTYFLVFRELSFQIQEDRVQAITALSPRWKLANGVAVGVAEEEVRRAMGPDYVLVKSSGKDFFLYPRAGVSFEIAKSKRTVLEINVQLPQWTGEGQRPTGVVPRDPSLIKSRGVDRAERLRRTDSLSAGDDRPRGCVTRC
jgi:beta-lactamase regulating signal transducer with metallopeptidase domain